MQSLFWKQPRFLTPMQPRHLSIAAIITIPVMCFLTVTAASRDDAACKEQDAISDQPIYDQFSDSGIDNCKWVVVRANWGGIKDGEDYNGGVVPENVSLRNKTLVLAARGNLYRGSVVGVDSSGHPRQNGQRSGAALMSRYRYLGGRFDARVKIINHPGVVSAMWTFFYDQLPGGTVRNHEIDIEFPGNANADAPPSLDHVTLTSWTGLNPGESTPAYRALPGSMADGKFHRLTFEWTPPAGGDPGSVVFYIDDRQLAVIRTNVPSEPSNLWLGTWFPQDWAGKPDFDQAEMLVEWVRITPLAKTISKN
jgi:beta-glucanase (GH16 family)